MASNIQRGTRGLSAGDWVRLKRLNGARTFTTDVTTNPDPRLEPETGRRVYTEFGTSKIRRPASNFTDYVASQKADYVLETPSGSCGAGKDLTINKLCTCVTSSAIKHNGLCRSCTHDLIISRPIGTSGGGGAVLNTWRAFTQVGSIQVNSIPSGATTVTAYVVGAGGAGTSYRGLSSGGSGAMIYATFPYSGDTITVYVGGGGGFGQINRQSASGGGGASAVSIGGNYIIAGGGGGSSAYGINGNSANSYRGTGNGGIANRGLTWQGGGGGGGGYNTEGGDSNNSGGPGGPGGAALFVNQGGDGADDDGTGIGGPGGIGGGGGGGCFGGGGGGGYSGGIGGRVGAGDGGTSFAFGMTSDGTSNETAVFTANAFNTLISGSGITPPATIGTGSTGSIVGNPGYVVLRFQ